MASFNLTNCNIVDVKKAKVIFHSAIAVDSGIITSISREEPAPGNSIDMQERYVLPGLFNLHSHLSLPFSAPEKDPLESEGIVALRCYRRAQDALNSGITTVRTVGERHRCDIPLKRYANEGKLSAPRIFAGGKGIGSSGGHGGTSQIEADGQDACLRAARTELGMGADQLKIFITGGMEKRDEVPEEPQMTKEEMSAVASACRSKGTYVTAHAGGSQAIVDAVDSGVSCFEHGYVLNREAAQAIRKANGFFVPTLSVTQTIEWYRSNKFEEWLIEKSLAAGKRHLQSVETAIEEGVNIACGTDIPPGDLNGEVNATVMELFLLSKTKLGSIGALRAGTINAAAVCRADRRLGLVEKGYAADLIAVARNPLENIECLKDISFVMKEGEIIRNDLREKG